MKKSLTVAAASTGLVIGSVLLAAPAQAAESFHGWAGTSYSGMKIVTSSTTANTTVDVADNMLSSGKNEQARTWCAVNVEVGANIVRFRFGPGTTNPTLGQFNKVTDFMWAGTAGTCKQ